MDNGQGLYDVEIGQQHVVIQKEDDLFDHMGGYVALNKTMNIKPDPKDETLLCYQC